MTQEDKNLLLKDLCARLPYNVKLFIINEVNIEKDVVLSLRNIPYIQMINMGYIKDCKPYLFPFSSMTEEQKEETSEMFWDFDNNEFTNNIEFVDHNDCFNLIDWLNKNHFDYRGLIEKGLAIDATGKNIY